jgi:hypothetical protein
MAVKTRNKLPLEYGPKEAEILRYLTESHKLPSKNEGFRRGIVALDYLMDADRGLLLEMLARMLSEAGEGLRDVKSFAEKLETSKALACEIAAVFAAQKGIESADSIDIFRADLDNYLILAKTEGFKAADKAKIAGRLSMLSEMASQFAKKESNSPERARTVGTYQGTMPVRLKTLL